MCTGNTRVNVCIAPLEVTSYYFEQIGVYPLLPLHSFNINTILRNVCISPLEVTSYYFEQIGVYPLLPLHTSNTVLCDVIIWIHQCTRNACKCTGLTFCSLVNALFHCF